MKVLMWSTPHCGECGRVMLVTPIPDLPQSAIRRIEAQCRESKCERAGIRLMIPMTYVDCEVSNGAVE